MAILDINKNSLPEQVQENKENIAALQTAMDDKASIEYVDEKDADTLQSAKDYTDDKAIPKSIFTKPGSLVVSDNDNNPKEFKTDGYSHGYITTNSDGLGHNGFAVQTRIPPSDMEALVVAGKVLTSDGNYGAAWQDPSIKAANVDSESATASQVLTADGTGGASWEDVPAGGETLVWSGSLTLAANTDLPFTPASNKRYKLLIATGLTSAPATTEFKYTDQYFSISRVLPWAATTFKVLLCSLNFSTVKVSSTYAFEVSTTNVIQSTGNLILKEVYEI